MTVGGDKLEHHADPRVPVLGLLGAKIRINSIILDAKKGEIYCVVGINDNCINNEIKVFQYMRVHNKYFTTEIRRAIINMNHLRHRIPN